MEDLSAQLSGGDRRSIGRSSVIASGINSREDFDSLWACLYHSDPLVALRAADCVEKVTARQQELLLGREEELLRLSRQACEKEMVWHLAQLLPRLRLDERQRNDAWAILLQWACDPTQSRIVRVNAIQALWDISVNHQWKQEELSRCLKKLMQERIPSLSARIRLLSKTRSEPT